MGVIDYFFAIMGYTIGTKPVTFISISALFFAISLMGPLFRLDIRMDLKSGFTRKDAPSMEEVSAHTNFFGNLGEPWYLALFAVAKNKSASLLRTNEGYEIRMFYKNITTAKILDRTTGKEFRYQGYSKKDITLCEPFCEFNSGLWKLLEYISFFNLTYPLASVGPFKANIGKFLFERTVNATGHVTSSKTIAIYFTTFVNDTTKARRLQLFEQHVLEQVHKHNAIETNKVIFVLHGAYAVSKEVQRGVKMAAPFYLVGSLLLVGFVIFSFIFTSIAYKQFYCSKAYLIAAAVICPLMASITAVGIMLLFGLHINMLVLISPFLTLAIGIGVDDSFLIINSWMQSRETSLAANHSPAERLQLIMEKIGAPMTVTSLTNVLGFALGCLAPVVEIRIFCSTIALSMLFDLVYQLTVFAPLLVLLAQHEPMEKSYKAVIDVNQGNGSLPQTVRRTILKLTKNYTKFLATWWARVLMLATLIGYLSLSLYGIKSLHANMDGKMLLPSDSQSIEGIRIISEIVWPDFLNINYIIRKPPNFSDPEQYRKFMRMVEAIERSKYAIGREGNMAWIFDYLRYLAKPSVSIYDIFWDPAPILVDENKAKETGLDMSSFQRFINQEPFDAWKSGVHYELDANNRTVIKQMLLMVGYKGTHSISDKARLLSLCREVARHYPEYDMVPFDTDSQIVDVILDVPHTTLNAMLFTVLAIGAVFFLFSCNFVTSVIATLSVASICIGVLGMLQYCGCDLNPLTMVAVIMTAGLGVDFTVHIAFHYFINEKHSNDVGSRINDAFHQCGLSTLQAGTSTFLIMFPVLFCPIGVYVIIAKAIVLVVIIGLIHGLFIVPVILGTIPQCLFGQKCCADVHL